MVIVRPVIHLQVHSEKPPECLPEGGAEGTQESLDDVVARLIGFTFYQFAQHIGL